VEAYRLVEGIEHGEDPNRLESFAWVRLRFSTPGDELWQEGLRALKRSLELPSPADSWRAGVKARYRGAFAGRDGNLPESLAAIVGEPPTGG
jgi:hypothetical protein